jgi:hypothetical protein
MAYDYQEQRPFVFTEKGQEKMLCVLDRARECLKQSGVVRADVLLNAAGGGDTWKHMACVERLVELGYLRALSGNKDRAWQHGVYEAGNKLP